MQGGQSGCESTRPDSTVSGTGLMATISYHLLPANLERVLQYVQCPGEPHLVVCMMGLTYR
jgi:hypothetical protein